MLGRADSAVPVALDRDLSDQFRAMGADMAPEAAPPADDEAFEIMPANWNAVYAWLRCETQWRVVATGTAVIRLGLDYTGVDVVLRRMGLADPDAVFADLGVMEMAALKVLREGAA